MKIVAVGSFFFFVFAVFLVCGDTVVTPVRVTSSAGNDVNSHINYLIADNPTYTKEMSLQRPVGTAVTLPSGADVALALATFHLRSGRGEAESWTQLIDRLPEEGAILVFDLTGGGNVDINSVILWQYGNHGGKRLSENDTKDFRMIFHTEAQGTVFDFSTEPVDLTAAMKKAGKTTDLNVAQQFTFTVKRARYAAMKIDSNHGIDGQLGPRYGLGEVRFSTPGGVPRVAAGYSNLRAPPRNTNLRSVAPPARTEIPDGDNAGALRTWHSLNGDAIDARFKKNYLGWITLERENGNIVRVHISKLCKQDRDYLKKLTL